MKRFALLAVAACGTHNAKPPPPPSPVTMPVTTPADAAGPIAPVVRGGDRAQRIEAPHAGAIVLLAAAPAGTPVLTVDELGGSRLWTALDGSAEPRVVDLARPVDIAIGPHPKGFVVGALDQVGALTVQLVDADGVTLQRLALPIEPAFGGVAAASDRGVLAWRVDQRIVLVAPETGAVSAQLAADSGQRILALAATADRAVAVIESSGKRRARWITLAPQLAWGAFLDGADDLGANVAMSPNGKRIASLTTEPRRGAIVVVLDAAGKLLARHPAGAALAAALPSDDHVALAQPRGVSWVALAGATTAPRAAAVLEPAAPATPLVAAAGGGRAVGAFNGQLVIATPRKTEFLGYALGSPSVAAAAPHGALLIGLGETFALLDDQLVARPAPDLRMPPRSVVADVRWLADDHWLVQSSRLDDGVTAVHLVDGASGKQHVVRKGMRMVHAMTHDPSTGLVALSLGDTPELLRHDPRKVRLEPVALVSKPKGFERTELAPVDPRLANGTQVVVVHMRDRLTLRWAKDAKQLDAAAGLVVDGSLASIDRAGRAYVWQSTRTGGLVLAMYRDGTALGQLPTDGPAAVWPDPTGTRVLQVSQRAVTLVGVDGRRVWAQPLQGVTEAVWLDDATVSLVSAGGVAHLDAATGHVRAARCGWQFGLSAKPHPVAPRVEPVCTQLPRSP